MLENFTSVISMIHPQNSRNTVSHNSVTLDYLPAICNAIERIQCDGYLPAKVKNHDHWNKSFPSSPVDFFFHS